MSKLLIKGVAYKDKGCCALSISDKLYSKFFEGILPTKNGGIVLDTSLGVYQTELYALVWGMALAPIGDEVVVVTNSLVIESLIKYSLVSYFDINLINKAYHELILSFLRIVDIKKLNVSVERVDIGKNKMMFKLRDELIELFKDIV